MPMRENILASDEFKQFLIADAVLIFAFSLTVTGGIFSFVKSPSASISNFLYFVPIMALVVTVSFIFHELMHKLVAQHYGAIAGFRTFPMGLAITFATSLFGFLFAIPGATMIYVQSFTKRQNGLVSLAGPLTNFVVFGIFAAVGIYFNVLGSGVQQTYLSTTVSFGLFISIILAFFNMLPMQPLDGSKVLAWSVPVYLVTMGAIFGIIYAFGILPITELVLLVIIALFFSVFYRHIF